MVDVQQIKNIVKSQGLNSILEIKKCNWNLKRMDFKYDKDTFELLMTPKKEDFVPAKKMPNLNLSNPFKALYSYLKILFKNRGQEPLKYQVDSDKELFQYAKDRIIPRLKAPIPHEFEVVSDGKKILRDFVGTQTGVQPLSYNTIDLLFPTAKLTTFHGHPNIKGSNKTFPVSLEDLYSMSSFQGQHKCVALNANGEYSSLTKLPEFKPLESNQIEKLTDEYEKKMYKHLPDDAKQEIDKLAQQYQTAKNKKLKKSLNGKIEKILDDFIGSEDAIPIVHNFWKENAEKIGVKYETNYSYLQDI